MISKKFFQFFPVPKYLNPHIAGLSISDNHIRFVFIEETEKGLRLTKHKEVDIPKGFIVSGDILNKEGVIDILEAIKKEMGILNIRVSIQEEKAYLFELEIPPVAQEEIKNTIEFKIEDHVPLKATDIIFDYNIISKSDTSLKIIVAALPRTVVELYEEVVISAGFSPWAIEIESQSISRAIVPDNANYLVVHFAKEKAGVCIVKEKLVHFTSTFLTMEQTGLVSIPKEINKIVHYFKDNFLKHENDFIKKILICGEVYDPILVSNIAQEVGIDTVIANPWNNVFDLNEYIPDISKKDSLRYVSSIGLAIPQSSLIV